MANGNSYRQILKSSSIIGGASVLNILISLVRTKVAAVILGPTGIGLIGLLQSMMATASAISALGLANVGTRQIAEAVAKGDDIALSVVRRSLFLGVLTLAAGGALVFLGLSDFIALHILDDGNRVTELRWMALGVLFSVGASSQSALLNGLRKIGDLAKLSIASSLGATVIGVTALLFWKERGLVVFIIAAPICTFFAGHWFVSKIVIPIKVHVPFVGILNQWRIMFRLGAAFMLSGVVVLLGQFALRAVIGRDLGSEALGQFQAAWAISMTYLGFVLSSMGTDYYPRLTATIHNRKNANRIVNEQTEVALLLAGPVLLLMLSLAPWVVNILYSKSFEVSISILRWQVLGDILKIASWPLGFVILAAGDGRRFLATESLGIGVLVVLTMVGIPLFGVMAAGMAFFAMYLVYLLIVLWVVKKKTDFVWDKRVLQSLLILMLVASSIMFLSTLSELIAAVLGSVVSLVFAVVAIAKLGKMANLTGALGRLSSFSRRLIENSGFWRK